MEDYNEWKQNFGIDYTWITTIIDNVRLANAGSGAFVSGATPEPTSAVLALMAGWPSAFVAESAHNKIVEAVEKLAARRRIVAAVELVKLQTSRA